VALVEVRVVKAPEPTEAAPIFTPSIVPPLISTVVTVPKSAQVAPAAVGEVMMVGEAMVGEVLKTKPSEPVSSVKIETKSAEVVVAETAPLEALRTPPNEPIVKLVVVEVPETLREPVTSKVACGQVLPMPICELYS
jgi:hypothetical protein